MARLAIILICLSTPLVQSMDKVADIQDIEQEWGFSLPSLNNMVASFSTHASNLVSEAKSKLNAHTTSVQSIFKDAMGKLTGVMKKMKDDAIAGFAKSTGMCVKFRQAASDATKKVQDDIQKQKLTAIDFTSPDGGKKQKNDCIKKVTVDVELELVAILKASGVPQKDFVQKAVGFIAESAASAGCASQGALDHIDLLAPLGALCPASETSLFTILGHPLFEQGTPTTAFVVPVMLITAMVTALAIHVVVRRSKHHAAEMLLESDVENVME